MSSSGSRGRYRGCGGIRPAAVFCTLALVGGAILSSASHLHDAAPPGRFLFGVFFGAVMAHFVIDAGLWRLRDAFPRAFLGWRLPYLVRADATEKRSPLTDRSSADIR